MPTTQPAVEASSLYIAILASSLVLVSGGIIFVLWQAIRGDRESRVAELASFMREANALRLLTVGAIVFVTSLLALAGRLESNAIAAILSGVAGYVLGGSTRTSPPDQPSLALRRSEVR